eukprot:gene16462-21030_t
MAMHTTWDVLADHCKLFVTFGGAPHKNAQISAGGAMVHRLKDGLYGMRAKGVRFINITPTAEDLDTGGDIEWLAIRPNTDAAMILALCHVLYTENLHDREFLDRVTERTLFLRADGGHAFRTRFSVAREELLRRDATSAARARQEDREIKRLEQAAARYKVWAVKNPDLNKRKNAVESRIA